MKKAQIEKVKKIIASVSGKDVAARRVEAIRNAGIPTSDIITKWNFGKTGTIQEVENGFWVQVAYATGGKSSSGYGVNACPCVFIKA